jgi:hypothetical protein
MFELSLNLDQLLLKKKQVYAKKVKENILFTTCKDF